MGKLALAHHARLMVTASALAMLTGACGSAVPCVQQTLPGFTLCVPPSWTPNKGRAVDTGAGRFSSGDLTVVYDHGLYADALRLPDGASAATESMVTLDGKPARQVGYTVAPAGQPARHVVGIHFRDLGPTSMGPLKLTLRAESSDATRLNEALETFATIRFAAPPKR